MTDEERFPLGKPAAPCPKPEPEWKRRIAARNSDTGNPPGIAQDEQGRWRTVNHQPPAKTCLHDAPTIMGHCVVCGQNLFP